MKKILKIALSFLLTICLSIFTYNNKKVEAKSDVASLKFECYDIDVKNCFKIVVTLSNNPGVMEAMFNLDYDRDYFEFYDYIICDDAFPLFDSEDKFSPIDGDMFDGHGDRKSKIAYWNELVESGNWNAGNGPESFTFSFSGDKEDSYNGELLTLYFKILKPNEAFEESINFKDVSFLTFKNKQEKKITLVIDNSIIKHEAGKDVEFISSSDTTKEVDPEMVIVIIVASTFVLGVIIYFVIKFINKKKNKHLTKI